MSDINMDLLELEDGSVGEDEVVFPDSVFSGDMSQQNVEVIFLKREKRKLKVKMMNRSHPHF